jgi:hypothetical protein
MVSEVLKAAVGVIGQQESIVVEKQPTVSEFDSLNR